MNIKIFTLKILLAGLSVCALSCQKSSNLDVEGSSKSSKGKSTIQSGADHIIETGMNLLQINAVIAGASAGQTVYVQPGTYIITGKIIMKPGVRIAKQTSTNPIFDATSLSNKLSLTYLDTEMNHCTFTGITFHNIRLIIKANSVAINYCIFNYAKRIPNTNDANNLNDEYIRLVNTDSSSVYRCVFAHAYTAPGRGVWLSNTTNSKVTYNTFGNGITSGYFITAINDNSQSNSLIDHNTINRNPDLPDSLTDHGIYAHGFDGLIITNNTISGWPPNANGGSMKIRNGQNVTVSNNVMNDSGVLLYEYGNTPAFPYLNNVVVANNSINIVNSATDGYHGICYYRDNATGTEYSIRIANNTLPNGTIWVNGAYVNTTNFNASSGGVYNNDTAPGYLFLKSGIANSGNF